VISLQYRPFEHTALASNYDITATFDCGGHAIKAKHNPSDADQVDEKGRLISESNARFIQDKVKEKTGLITLAITKPEKKQPPQPLNLSTLQQALSRRSQRTYAAFYCESQGH